MGTETDGSVVCPATREALYSLKVTVGAVDMTGVQAAGNTFFTPGGLTKCVADLATLTSVLLSRPSLEEIPTSTSWDSINLAFVDPRKWRFAADVCEPREDFFNRTVSLYAPGRTSLPFSDIRQDTATFAAIEKIEEAGGRPLRNTPFPTTEEFFKDLGWSGYKAILGTWPQLVSGFFIADSSSSPSSTNT